MNTVKKIQGDYNIVSSYLDMDKETSEPLPSAGRGDVVVTTDQFRVNGSVEIDDNIEEFNSNSPGAVAPASITTSSNFFNGQVRFNTSNNSVEYFNGQEFVLLPVSI